MRFKQLLSAYKKGEPDSKSLNKNLGLRKNQKHFRKN